MTSTSAKHTEHTNQSPHEKAKKDVECAERIVNNSVDVSASASPSLDSDDHVLFHQLRRVTSIIYNEFDNLNESPWASTPSESRWVHLRL
jgi:hypothetical protein